MPNDVVYIGQIDARTQCKAVTGYPYKKSGCFYKLIVLLVWIEHDTWEDAYTVYPNRGVGQ